VAPQAQTSYSQKIALVVALAIALVALSPPERVDSFQASGPYRQGDRVPEIQGVDFARRPATLLVVLREACPDCTASMAFYKRVAEGSRRAQVIVVSPDAPDVLATYLETHAVEPDQALSLKTALRVAGTPTLYLVDRDRTVLEAWQGKLPPTLEHDVVRAVR
jgi:peroxiredoxin